MRPTKLKMSAFGPYAGVSEIDFKNFDGCNIFLVTGPTGAGKTTIFDAISYAIFGKTSGDDRDADSVRSHFAKPDTLTYVELEFTLNGKSYYIKRIPAQLRPKERGEGETLQKSDAELKLEGSRTISGVKDVDEEIKSILSLSYEQFRQIVMIPQGEFKKLLLSDSKDREDIFRNIFGTYEFQRIQKLLDEKAKIFKKEIEILSENRKTYISGIDCSDSETLDGLIKSDNKNIAEIVIKLEDYIKKDKAFEKEKRELKKELELLSQNTQTEITKGEEINKKLQERQRLLSKKSELLKKGDEYNNKEKRLQCAKKAEKVYLSENVYNSLAEDAKAKKNEYEIAIQNEKELSQKLINIKNTLELEEKKDIEREELNKEILVLKDRMQKVEEYEKSQSILKQLKISVKKHENEKINLQSTIESLKLRINETTQRLNGSKEAEIQYLKLEASKKQKEQLKERIEALHKEDIRLQNIRVEYKKLKDEVRNFENEYKNAKSLYEAKNEIFLKGQAGLLAKELEYKKPCPVCGSIDHPNKAALIEGIPSEHELKSKKSDFESKQNKYNEMMKTLAELNAKGMEQNNNINKIKKQIMPLIDDDIKDLEKEALTNFINQNLKDITHELSTIFGLMSENEIKKNMKVELEKNLINLQKELEKEEVKKTEAEALYTELLSKYRVIQDRLDKLKNELPEGILSLTALNDLILQKEKKYKDMQKALLNAQNGFNDCSIKCSVAVEALRLKEEELKKIGSKQKKAKEAFLQSIITQGFGDINEYSESKLLEATINELESDIKLYRQECNSIESLIKKSDEDTFGLSPIDISILGDNLNEIKHNIEKAEKDINKFYSRISQNEKAYSEIQKLNIKIIKKEEVYKKVGELARTANGNNYAKISFERYVLATYFDEIITAANIRLKKMTGGRYIMSRIKDKQKGAAQQGLDIEVYDYYTGKGRHAKTLSGGESFKASLALALGLSDIVQSHSGGISLDTMFVDEGFGTLDPESLDSAIGCLLELQKTGRLVGVISHVAELKERIQSRIEICPSMIGSTLEVVI